MTASVKPLAAGWTVALGALAAVVGMVPWVLSGLRLPLQNLWATSTLDMPIVLLPFSQYALTDAAGILVTGAALAGLAARALRERMPRPGLVVAGVGVVQLVAIAQTAVAVVAGLQRSTPALLYFAAVLAWITLSLLIGLVCLMLVMRAPRAGVLIGLTLGAIGAGLWLRALIMPFGTVTPVPVQLWAVQSAMWIVPLLVGGAIAWCGVRTPGRAVGAVASLAMLWLLPPAIDTVASAAGMRVYAHQPAELLRFAQAVFVERLGVMPLGVLPVLVAVAVAAIGLVARRSARALEPARG